MISIIVTSYNRVDYLVKSLNSLSKQTFQDFEVILVTNFQFYGDSYGFKCIKYIVMDGKTGEALAEGIMMSNGEVICFRDDGEMLTKERVSYVNHKFENGLLISTTK